MKKIKFFAVALATIAMFSCSKESTGTLDTTERVMTVKIAKKASSKAAEAPGTDATGTISLTNGVIFTVNGDAVVGAYAIVPAEIQGGTGQTLTDKVTSSITVFVVANIPADLVTEWTAADTKPASLSDIKEKVLAITAENGSNYKKATLFNAGGTAATQGTPLDEKVSAAVTISPVYSRLELPKIVAEGNVDSFTVTGVFVDESYPSYTIGGLFGGTMNDMQQTTPSTEWPAAAKDLGTWKSANKVVELGSTNVWAYNLPSGNLPRLIIQLTNVVVSGKELTGTWYLTVKKYTGIAGNFVPGNIYSVTNGLKFDETKVGPTPNPLENTLTVNLSIKEWTLVGVSTEL